MRDAAALLAEFKRLIEQRDAYIFTLEADKGRLAAENARLRTALNELQARLMEAAAMKDHRSH